MKKKFLTSLVFLYCSIAFAQAPDTLWTKKFGGSGNETGTIQQTADSGYIIIGSTSSYGAGDSDVWLIKIDEDGNEMWNKTFGGSNVDYGMSGQQTSDGGYIICGMTKSFGAGDFDAWLIKTDEIGNELWNKTFGEANIDAGQLVQQTFDGSYIMAGYRLPSGATIIDAWLLKTDENGIELWNKTYGGENLDRISTVKQTSDSGYIATGFTDSFGAGQWDAYLLKTNISGDEVWTKTFGGSTDDACSYVEQTFDGEYILVGMTTSFGAGNMDLWLIKTDGNGNELWNKSFGGTNSDQGGSVIQISDGNYVILGSTSSYGSGNSDIWLIKADGNGNISWSTTYGTADDEYGGLVQQTFDGGYIISGLSGFWPDDDIWVIKTEPDPALLFIDLNNTQTLSYNLIQNYPNPFNPSTKISWEAPVGSWQTLKIYDVLGNEVATLVDEYKPAGKYEVEFDAIDLSSGIYFYQLKTENNIKTKKMILLK